MLVNLAAAACLSLCEGPPENSTAKSDADWPDGEPRWFAAGRFDAGLILKASGYFGYGQPFWMWAGLQAAATGATDFFTISTGVRLSLPVIEFTAEYRRTEPYLRGPLPAQDQYDSDDLGATRREGYDALDLDLWGVIPLPYSFIFAEVTATWLPDRRRRYEESLRAVVEGWCGSARGGVGARVGDDGWIRIGVLAEVVVSERPTTPGFRVGPSIQLVFGSSTDLVLAGLWPVSGEDDFAPIDALTGAVALRWRMTTGGPPLSFP